MNKLRPRPSYLFISLLICIGVNFNSGSFVSAQGLQHPGASSSIEVELFDPGYLEGDSNYHSLTAASDGKIYFSVNSHQRTSSARIYIFDPATKAIELAGDISNELGLDTSIETPHGKVHTPLVEHNGFLYFATHTSQYTGNLPEMAPQGRTPYEGGHFMRYNLKTGTFEDLAHLKLANEGIITMALDTATETLYGLTWPTGLLISYNLEERLLNNWGAVQERGEFGRLPDEWDFICRRLGVDPDGNIYGSTDSGRVWHFQKGKQRPVDFLDPLSLDYVPEVQNSSFEHPPEPHYFWRNWRTIQWNPGTESFWGLHGGSSQLFEFDPSEGSLRSVRPMRVEGVVEGRRNPFRTQLGFTIGPDNTIYYLAHGPGLQMQGRRDVSTSVHLLTYNIVRGDFTDHGMLVGPEGRRVFFTESIEIGPDGRVYSVAWVEIVDTDRMAEVQTARGNAVPEETTEIIYEMQLVKLPDLSKFDR